MTLAKRSMNAIAALEEFSREQPQVEIQTIERMIGAMYVREIIIPKGATITGRVYKRTYVDIMLSGDITVTDSNGTYRLEGFNCLEGTSGRKRAGYAHEETRWLTVHDSVDLKTNIPIDDLSFETIPEYLEYSSKCSNESFERFLVDNDLSALTVLGESKYEPYEPIESDYYLDDSLINGTGVFTSKPYRAGEVIGPMVRDDKKTQLGRYVNHSDYPNAIQYQGDMVAVRCIDSGKEITTNYNLSERLLK